jgi:hypothetical protein
MTRKRHRRILSAGLLFLLALPAWPRELWAANPPLASQEYAFSTNINGPLQQDVLYVFPLSGEILARADKSLSDIRLFDSSGQETPLVIIKNVIPPKPEQWVALKPTGYDEEDGVRSILIAKPKDVGPIRGIGLDVSGKNFQLDAEVFSSPDKLVWTSLRKGTVYDSPDVNLRKLTLEFAQTDAPFFLLHLWEERSKPKLPTIRNCQYGTPTEASHSGLGLPFKLNGILVMTEAKQEGRAQFDEMRLTQFQVASANRQTTVEFSTALPLEKISIKANDTFYQRQATIWGRDQESVSSAAKRRPNKETSENGPEREGFRLVGQGVLRNSKIIDQNTSQDALTCAPGKNDLWRIVIEDKDSPPLNISEIRLSWTQPLAFFIAKDTSGYTLRFGQPKAQPPVYDLGKSVTQGNWWTLSAVPATLGPITENATAPRTRSARIDPPSWLLTALTLTLSLGMGVWILRLLRAAPKPKDDSHASSQQSHESRRPPS